MHPQVAVWKFVFSYTVGPSMTAQRRLADTSSDEEEDSANRRRQSRQQQQHAEPTFEQLADGSKLEKEAVSENHRSTHRLLFVWILAAVDS